MEPPVLDLPKLIALRVTIAAVAASGGALFAVGFKKISHLWLCVLISFAAGALFSVSVFDILPEAVHTAGIWPAALSFVSGYVLFFLITRFVFHICPACAATHLEVNFKTVTAAMIVALSVHSFMDGLAIYGGTLAGSSLGVVVLVAVAYHKFPEGMALTLISLGSGKTRRSAFWLTFAVETGTTVMGGFAGLLLALRGPAVWTGYLMAHVAGGFAYIVVHALRSEMIRHHPKYTLIAAFLGALSIACVTFFIGEI